MLKAISGNILILILAFFYWFAVDYIYAKNFELYHPFKWLIQVSFLVFALLSFDYTYKVNSDLERKNRVIYSLIARFVLIVVFLLVLHRFGIDFHFWVGHLLLRQ